MLCCSLVDLSTVTRVRRLIDDATSQAQSFCSTAKAMEL
jgi:hypothetical protein